MDPQVRLLLEVSYEAIIDAGKCPRLATCFWDLTNERWFSTHCVLGNLEPVIIHWVGSADLLP